MAKVSPETVAWIIGLFGMNLAGIITAFVTFKVNDAVLKVKVDRLEKDLDALWKRLRQYEKFFQKGE